MNKQRRDFLKRYDGFRVAVPTGRDRLYEVSRHFMTKREADIANIMAKVLRSDRWTVSGEYTQLVRFGKNDNPYDSTIVMTDHPCEVADHAALVNYAQAHAPLKHVLINGLGLGVAIVLLMPYVDHFTIIELAPSVIRLVGPHYQQQLGDRLDIIQQDALTYRPPKGEHYNAVFHDIWDTISHENLPQMRHLQRRYGRRSDWQESWARVYCEREALKRKRNPDAYKDPVNLKDVYREANQILAVKGVANA